MKLIKMENKTAMQEMLEWTRKTFPMDLDTPRMIEDKIESLLTKEKEQIKKAYLADVDDEFHEMFDTNALFEKYYNQTYGTK